MSLPRRLWLRLRKTPRSLWQPKELSSSHGKRRVAGRGHWMKLRGYPNAKKRKAREEFLQMLRDGRTAEEVRHPEVYLNSAARKAQGA